MPISNVGHSPNPFAVCVSQLVPNMELDFRMWNPCITHLLADWIATYVHPILEEE
jgi:hypothetical protein